MFFLSSPVQPPPQPHYSSNPFAPSTPSPLRTSYNANIVRRPRMSDQQPHKTPAHTLSSPLGKPSTPWPSNADENIFSPPTPSTSTSTPATTTASFDTPSTSTFTFTAPAPSASVSGPSFAFASRARAASPANQLSSRAAATKAQNKARFLDRIRTKRDEGLGRDDKALRADYLGERRAWEAEMARRAVVEEEPDDIDEGDGGMMAEAEAEEQSPTDEKEIEALVALMEQQDDAEERVAEDGDSQEWDEVFMEVLSQQEPHLALQPPPARDTGANAARDGMDVDMS